MKKIVVILFLCLVFTDISSQKDTMVIILKSKAFTDGGFIPIQFSYYDINHSPPLSWSDVPINTKSIAIMCDDPDAPGGSFLHWLIWDIPPSQKELFENVPTKDILPNGSIQGMNDFGETGYSGMAPPSGIHKYIFRIFALDIKIGKREISNKKEFLSIIKGHIIAEGLLMGKFTALD